MQHKLLYHVAPIRLAPDSVILPGNWGRIIRAIGETHGKWEMETIFERVRQESYVHLPSRLDSCFACLSPEVLRFYAEHVASKGNRCPQVLYEVGKVDPDAPEHRTDFNLIAANLPGETLEGNAARYWAGEFRYNIAEHPGMQCEEIITTSPLRIVRELD